MANAKKSCGCGGGGAYAIFKINTASAAWGSIVGDIKLQQDLMDLLSQCFTIENVEPKGNISIEQDPDGNWVFATKTLEFEQGQASDTWVIQHNLNKYPNVVTVDSAGNEFKAEVTYDSLNQVTISINGATKGKAYLN